MKTKPNLAVAFSTDEWRDEYRAHLLRFLPDASEDALDANNDLVMQGRMIGDTPEQCAAFIAAYVKAHETAED